MNFFEVKTKCPKRGTTNIFPAFKVVPDSDLMIRGKSFYAVWNEENGLWSKDEYDVQRLVDKALWDAKSKIVTDDILQVLPMKDFNSRSWQEYKKYVISVPDNAHVLDSKVIFADTETKKTDYASKRLPYSLRDGPMDAYEELMSTLYEPEERAKLEWGVGSILAGDSKDIQKFFVLYGGAGKGKSTFLNILQKLFDGYYSTFDAKALGSSSNIFAVEALKDNPLIAIQHDGDLSRIEDNTRLNSIVSHEEMLMNEKHKSVYRFKPICMLYLGTNQPVKITDAKSGILRRLIDVVPTGKTVPTNRYFTLINQIDFELGVIAKHCLDAYLSMGKNYYQNYRPLRMMYKTDAFFNFVEAYSDIFMDGMITLKRAYSMYKDYGVEASLGYSMPMYKFREELKNYFERFDETVMIDGQRYRSLYRGFLPEKLYLEDSPPEQPVSLVLDKTTSILDDICSDYPAQYATSDDIPSMKWSDVETCLKEIDTSKVHFLKLPLNHIVIDFDLRDENGEKSIDKNLEAASKWPATYTEISKGGNGVHLHYIFDGDVKSLEKLYSDGIEIKTFPGNSALRRRVSLCNDIPIRTINSGLPTKEDKVIDFTSVKSEKALRNLIERNLRKEIHPGTKPSMDFIKKILDDAYSSGLHYDVSDMRNKILIFASGSTNQADYCLELMSQLKFKSDEPSKSTSTYIFDEIVFFDVEVFPNLFLVNWKYAGEDKECVHMINPTPSEIETLMQHKLVGFNCRRYDNHILYARYLGYSNKQLFDLSQKIVEDRGGMFSEAYNISYTDIYDFASAGNKKSLKKFEIELGIHHQELGMPWNEPVPEEKWVEVAEYCDNDVKATEAVFNHLQGDWTARQILAEISGLSVNDSTNSHVAKIIFGDDTNTQDSLVYTDLSTIFPGYKFENGKSHYRGEEVGEGGYVYSEPGMYGNVALLDVVSMHPTSIEQLNLFGPYTAIFSRLKKTRVLIKHKQYDEAKAMWEGKLDSYLTDDKTAKELSNALKTVINSVYGLTAAKFDNKFRDKRNIDNIVAKRGALFMIDLKHAVQEKGYSVAHIKTDSIKIPDADDEIISFVMDFGKKYGYEFEHEDTYDRMCLVNDAVYIARGKDGHWSPTGAQFAHPYIFKTLFSHEELVFDDLCETKSVKTAIYLDMNENLPEGEHDYRFVGKVGSFCPVIFGGGKLVRIKDDKYYAVTGTKDYRWEEAEKLRASNKVPDIDMSYFEMLVKEAKESISNYGDFDWFVSDKPYDKFDNGILPF